MYQKILSVFLCFLSLLLINNPAMAISDKHNLSNKVINIENYSPDIISFMNISQGSEPIYLARERRVREASVSLNWIGSIFIAGLGQMLLGDIGRGILFLIGTSVGYLLFFLPGLIIHIWCISDAYDMAKRQADREYIEDEARILEERMTKIINNFDRITTDSGSIKYNLASF